MPLHGLSYELSRKTTLRLRLLSLPVVATECSRKHPPLTVRSHVQARSMQCSTISGSSAASSQQLPSRMLIHEVIRAGLRLMQSSTAPWLNSTNVCLSLYIKPWKPTPSLDLWCVAHSNFAVTAYIGLSFGQQLMPRGQTYCTSSRIVQG